MQPGVLPLFEDDDSGPRVERPTERSLVLKPTAGRTLGAKERAFNRLIQEVQTRRDRLESERRRLDQLLAFHAAQVHPRLVRVTALRKEVVRALQPFLDDGRLGIGARKVLGTTVARQFDEILAHDEMPEPDLRALFERLKGVAVEQMVEDSLEDARAQMAEMFAHLGIDVDVPDLRPGMTEAEVAAVVARMAESLRQSEEAQAAWRPKPRRRTKRQVREEEQRRKVEEMRKVSIGAVYKRLVKALHPDLERDPAERARKDALMQEVTAAFSRNDMHALLRLELEWIGRAPTEAARLSDAVMRAYTQCLQEQAAQLRDECEGLLFDARYAPIVRTDGVFGIPRAVDGPAEVERLEAVIDGMAAALERFAAGNGLPEVREIVRQQRQADRQERRRS